MSSAVLDLHTEIYEQHLMEAGFLWLLRDNAVCDVAYDLDDLCELDERVEAHLDGLRLGADEAWNVCRQQLDDMDGGEAFAAMSVAICSGELEPVAQVLDVAGGAPDTARGLASALGWATLEQAQRLLPGLLYPRCPAPLHHIGIAAAAAHRTDPGPSLDKALRSDDLRLRARALRAVGECQRWDLHAELDDALQSDDPTCRYAAGWSAVVLGRPQGASTLWDVATSGGPFAEGATSMAVRRLAPADAAARLCELHGSNPRAAITGAASAGTSASLPGLLDALTEPTTARLATQAIHHITGLDLDAGELEGSAPEGFRAGPSDDPDDEDTALDPDESVPWLDPEAVRRWCAGHTAELASDTRYILGKPMTPPWLQQVLARGRQPVRASAALELAIRAPDRGFEQVRAPGFRQRRD